MVHIELKTEFEDHWELHPRVPEHLIIDFIAEQQPRLEVLGVTTAYVNLVLRG